MAAVVDPDVSDSIMWLLRRHGIQLTNVPALTKRLNAGPKLTFTTSGRSRLFTKEVTALPLQTPNSQISLMANGFRH